MRVKKYLYLILPILVLVPTFFIYNNQINKDEEKPFLEYCTEENCYPVKNCFNGSCSNEINPKFYDPQKAFWIFDTVNSYDCSRIEDAILETTDDELLLDYFKINLELCKYEVSSGKRFEKIIVNDGFFDKVIPYEDIYPDGTVFVAPQEYA